MSNTQKSMKYYKLQSYESGMFPTDRSKFTTKLWYVKLKGKLLKLFNKNPIAIVVFEETDNPLTPVEPQTNKQLKDVEYIWLRTYAIGHILETKTLETIDPDNLARNDVIEYKEGKVYEDKPLRANVITSVSKDPEAQKTYHLEQDLLLDMPDEDFYN